MQARVYQGAEPIRASAFPYPLNPFTWYGVVETHDFFVQTQVDSLTPEVDPHDNMQIRYKPEETPASLAAKSSYLGRVYLDWARYPLVEVEHLSPPESGYRVRFQDLRFRVSGLIAWPTDRNRGIGREPSRDLGTVWLDGTSPGSGCRSATVRLSGT